MTLLIPLLYALLALGEVERVVEEEEEEEEEIEEEEPRIGRGREVGSMGMEGSRGRGEGEGESDESDSSELRSITSTSFSSIPIGEGYIGREGEGERGGASRSARFLSPTIMDAMPLEGVYELSLSEGSDLLSILSEISDLANLLEISDLLEMSDASDSSDSSSLDGFFCKEAPIILARCRRDKKIGSISITRVSSEETR